MNEQDLLNIIAKCYICTYVFKKCLLDSKLYNLIVKRLSLGKDYSLVDVTHPQHTMRLELSYIHNMVLYIKIDTRILKRMPITRNITLVVPNFKFIMIILKFIYYIIYYLKIYFFVKISKITSIIKYF